MVGLVVLWRMVEEMMGGRRLLRPFSPPMTVSLRYSLLPFLSALLRRQTSFLFPGCNLDKWLCFLDNDNSLLMTIITVHMEGY